MSAEAQLAVRVSAEQRVEVNRYVAHDGVEIDPGPGGCRIQTQCDVVDRYCATIGAVGAIAASARANREVAQSEVLLENWRRGTEPRDKCAQDCVQVLDCNATAGGVQYAVQIVAFGRVGARTGGHAE